MQIDFERIPFEMKAYRQWVCWMYEDRGGPKPTKIPYDPRTGRMASVTDLNTWVSFEEARHYAPNYSGIGFVLTKDDPYCFVDLDDTKGNTVSLERQKKIFAEFDSYSERSPSGTGLHIICKAHILNGRRRSDIELYSNERYMTMTGDVFENKPIAERQAIATILWSEMGGPASDQLYAGNAPVTMTDEAVIEKAANAANGAKFIELGQGRWEQFYPSQSEADLALVDMIAFYTQNEAQVTRIFLSSALGQRDKAKRPAYMKYMLRKCFDNILPPIDIVALDRSIEAYKIDYKVNHTPPELAFAENAPVQDIRAMWNPVKILPPPGVLGDMARFIYDAAPRPCPEAAITAAIGLLAGMTGRAYNISGTGLNQYVLLLAQTGIGKEGMAGGIDKLLTSVITGCPAAGAFRGPAEIASGQALLKRLANDTPCFVSVVGEFGLKMKQLADPRASASEITLKKVLLDLYNKSGTTASVGTSVYADATKNSAVVKSPSFTLLGEATPETFYSALDSSMIADGLLPRFMVIQYEGDRPPFNKGHEKIQVPLQLTAQLIELAEYSLMLQNKGMVLNVEYDEDAERFLDNVNSTVDRAINSTKTDALRHLWNRAHIKTLKLAALVAVGCNYTHPKITLEIAQWAYNVISTDILGMVNKFTRGEIGKNTEENAQGANMLRVCLDFCTKHYDEVKTYGIDEQLHKDHVIPYSYISRRLLTNSAFRNDRRGGTAALKATVQGLIDSGDLQEMGRHQMTTKYSYSGRAFVIASPQTLPATIYD